MSGDEVEEKTNVRSRVFGSHTITLGAVVQSSDRIYVPRSRDIKTWSVTGEGENTINTPHRSIITFISQSPPTHSGSIFLASCDWSGLVALYDSHWNFKYSFQAPNPPAATVKFLTPTKLVVLSRGQDDFKPGCVVIYELGDLGVVGKSEELYDNIWQIACHYGDLFVWKWVEPVFTLTRYNEELGVVNQFEMMSEKSAAIGHAVSDQHIVLALSSRDLILLDSETMVQKDSSKLKAVSKSPIWAIVFVSEDEVLLQQSRDNFIVLNLVTGSTVKSFRGPSGFVCFMELVDLSLWIGTVDGVFRVKFSSKDIFQESDLNSGLLELKTEMSSFLFHEIACCGVCLDDNYIVSGDLGGNILVWDSSLPGDKPSLPGDKPSLPGDKPSLPGDKPSLPGDKPSLPGDKPSLPGDKPSLPGDKPSLPGDKPSLPGDKPSLPGDKPSLPGDKPSLPGDKPSLPGDKPSLPGDKPSLPGDKPSLPGDKPSLPGDKPSLPGDKPSLPGDKPSLPGDKPSLHDNPVFRTKIEDSVRCLNSVRTGEDVIVFIGTLSGCLLQWDMCSEPKVVTYKEDTITCIRTTCDRLCFGMVTGDIELYEISSARVLTKLFDLRVHNPVVSVTDPSLPGDKPSLHDNPVISQTDPRFGSLNLKAEVWSLEFSPCSTKIATCSEDQTVKITSLDTQQTLSTFKDHALAVTCLSWVLHSGLSLLLSCSDDNTVVIRETITSVKLRQLVLPSGMVGFCTLTYIGVLTPSLPAELPKTDRPITGTNVSEIFEECSRKITVACGSENGYLILRDVVDGGVLFNERVHQGSIEGLACEGGRVVTCSSDCCVQVHDV